MKKRVWSVMVVTDDYRPVRFDGIVARRKKVAVVIASTVFCEGERGYVGRLRFHAVEVGYAAF